MNMHNTVRNIILALLPGLCPQLLQAQQATLRGTVQANGQATVELVRTKQQTITDSTGRFSFANVPTGKVWLRITSTGFTTLEKSIWHHTTPSDTLHQFVLQPVAAILNDVVVTGTLKAVNRLESPVPVEIYSPAFFKKNPTPSIFDALQNVNGCRPQQNCNVCNAGDIHINGMEGPYTMVLIDGMPIVSSLGAVYGLSGIPNALIERVEIVRGPASSLYGSEAVGGLINVITKSPDGSPKVSADVMTTSWLEHNIDLGLVAKAGKRMSMLLGINYFNFSQKTDHNKDQFTDVTLQDRLSIYQKWILHRQSKKAFAVAARYMYEDRWGGDLRWNKQFRGGDSIYGESIFTNRWEISGLYQLPGRENLQLQFSYNSHNQNSAYATTSYIARQNIAFAQLTWDKKTGRHDLLSGIALRYTYYDDNTPGTGTPLINAPQKTWLPGIFVQDEIRMAANKSLLLGLRYDHNNYHGNIFTPRLAFKWTLRPGSLLRLNAGTGFRVVNLFTEDHAALTGARIVEIKNELRPERSYNVNINLAKKIRLPGNTRLNLELTAFYTYFNNRIVGDYDRDPNKIIYDNLEGYAENKGVSLNADVTFKNGIRTSLGATIMENTLTTQGNTVQQILSENGTGTWLIGYTIKKLHTSIDYTGNIYSPMRLPLLGDLDPRSPRSPWWSIQNIQATFTGLRNIEVYGGVKNLLNWTPNRGNPFIIARAFDPFDKQVQFDANGQPMATPGNPNALTFDPTYVYAPNQGIRWFIGIRTNLKPGRK